MVAYQNISTRFKQGLNQLGFAVADAYDDALFLVGDIPEEDYIDIIFHLNNAKTFGADAVYLRKQLNGSYKPQVYLFDKTDESFSEQNEKNIADIQTKLWTSGEVPLACFFYNTNIKILDCTKHITKDYKPEYLVQNLKYTAKADKLYNEQFAVKIKTGIFWDEEVNKDKFKFSNSAYGKLIENIHKVREQLSKVLQGVDAQIISKIIVQSILIKYLEERKSLNKDYFQKYAEENSLADVLRNGKILAFLDVLNDKDTGLNGNVFKWEETEKAKLKGKDLSILAEFLETSKTDVNSTQQELFPDMRYFEFQYIPVELISRLYEEFLGENKAENGLYYTPSHLAKLLVDECLPLKKYQEVDLTKFNALDPACGSGIFLVLVFKRLVQMWKLQNRDKKSNELLPPTIPVLKSLLRNIYGVDKEGEAVNLAAFSLSLALCDELKPKEIIDNLKFDDLRESNLITHDFFTCEKIKNKKFDLIIGNPPFVRGGISEYSNICKIRNEQVAIPQGQIALKFLSESFLNLKEKGLVCLIIKSSELLYNSSEYKKALFSNYNVVQILDFTALARNKSLWENGADVESASIFARNEKPDFTKNILHLTFRRTKATKERIAFEIDSYDLHFINRQTAIENEFIWKNNLLGGGRIKTSIEKLSIVRKLDVLLQEHKIIVREGASGPKSLPNKAFSAQKIDSSFLTDEYNLSFVGKKDKKVYEYPNLLIKENLDLPICLNKEPIKFNNETVGISSKNEKLLNDILNYFLKNHDILKFYNICSSGKMLVYKNTTCKKEDIVNLPFDLNIDLSSLLSEYDFNIIRDVNETMQYFLRNGENSKAVKSIKTQKEKESIITNYGAEFSKVLNLIYEKDNRKFRLSNVIELKNSLIATVFRYDTENKEVDFTTDISELNIENLTVNKISSALSVNRIIKLYPAKDTVVFVKPNQYRYWLSLIAYRDADSCFADYAEAGY